VQVGAAHSGGADPDQYLTGSRSRYLALPDAKAQVFPDLNGAHRC
jgi:hypothetical protein